MKLIEMKKVVKELLEEKGLNCKVYVKTENMKIEFSKDTTDEEIEKWADVVEIEEREATIKKYNIEITGDLRYENIKTFTKVEELLEEVKKEINLHLYIING